MLYMRGTEEMNLSIYYFTESDMMLRIYLSLEIQSYS